MSSSDQTPIAWLAERCANCGLGLQDARALFEALYIGDALAKAGGNVSHAAEIAGVARTTIIRQRKRSHQGEDLRSRASNHLRGGHGLQPR